MRIQVLLAVLTAAAAATAGDSQGVCVYRTENRGEMREVVANFWSRHSVPGGNVIDLDAAKHDHDFLGLGVSFPEASCYLLAKLPAEKRRSILEMIWTKKGANLSVGRIHCGSSDYSMHVYSYDDTPGDAAMRDFTIDEDRQHVLPVIKEAKTLNPDIWFFSSTWSPPAWMKDNQSFGGGRVLPKWYDAYANYLVRFLQEYAREGVDIRAFTVQNEPTSTQDFMSPTCLWTGEEECALIKDHLLPKLAAAGLKARPWLFDFDFSHTGRVEKCLADEALRRSIGAVAWHSYSGKPEMILPIHRKYPDLPMVHTEMGPHVVRDARPMLWWSDLVLATLRSGCGAFTSWCMVLDENGQPNVSRGFPCAGFVELNSKTGAIVPSEQFKMFRHIGPFVSRGAAVLDATLRLSSVEWSRKNAERMDFLAFRNLDGSHAVVLGCHGFPDREHSDPVQVLIKLRGRYLNVQLLADSLTTVVLK